MFEIHTPKSWYSIFNFPSIIVDDGGLIYNSDDYYRLFRNPIGKIDYNSGYIYGEDDCKLLPIPIGRMKQDGTVTIVFGKDYNTLSPTPILYINGNEVYSYKEYHKLFSTPSYYIKSDPEKKYQKLNPTYTSGVSQSLNLRKGTLLFSRP